MKHLKAIGLAAATAAVAAGSGQAQDAKYAAVNVPSTVEVIVAASAGGSSDALVRVTMPFWEKAIEALSGRQVSAVVKNLPGAGTEIGATALAGAGPDGSTIGLMNLPHIPLLEAARDPEFEPWLESFTPLGLNVVDPNVLILGESSPYGTIEEAVAAAEESPGTVVVGAQGPLSDDQLALYALEAATGAKFAFVPYAGGSDANRALRTGEIDLTVGNAFDYVQLEDVAKDAVVFSPDRFEMIGAVPTVREALGVETGELASTRGFAAPVGLPEDLLALYREALETAFNDPAYRKEAKERNITLVEPRMGEAFGDVMRNQQDTVSRLVEYFEQGGYLE